MSWMVLGLCVDGDICATAVSMKFNLHKLEAANYQKLERERERGKKQEEKVAELFLVDLVLP